MLPDFAGLFFIKSSSCCELLEKIFRYLVEILADREVLSEVIYGVKKLWGYLLFVSVRIEKMKHPNHYEYSDWSQ
jgi:hypothetical protein